MKYGLLVSLEGLDKSGKSTQVGELAKLFALDGEEVVIIHFPDYETITGQVISAVLEDYHVLNPKDNAHEFQGLYVLNRYEQQQRIEHALMQGKVVICDRYIHSSVAYGVPNGLNREWLESVQHSLIKPDVVVYIDISEQEYIERSKNYDHLDVHESDLTFLRKVRNTYLELSSTEENWVVANGVGEKVQVANRIYESIKQKLVVPEG